MHGGKRFLVILLSFCSYVSSNATERKLYYGQNFYNRIEDLSNTGQLKHELYNILNSYHISEPTTEDIIVKKCPNEKNCWRHQFKTYKEARQFLFGDLYLEHDSDGPYVKGVYCNYKYRNQDFPKGDGLGENKIPAVNIINTEHSWPQSKFNPKEPKKLQKSDLFILFPASREANSLRSNLDFQELDTIEDSVCNESAKGFAKFMDGKFFEPPAEHKGNVARALFYFSVRYRMPIADSVENTLRLWHINDPVDTLEYTRNEKIFTFQKVRNPFIDHEWLVNFINNF
ncbi:MAG: endonuclease [Bdellovibrionales bacterium]|nr:endonuclease [Bdellovibrionales bacterium]